MGDNSASQSIAMMGDNSAYNSIAMMGDNSTYNSIAMMGNNSTYQSIAITGDNSAYHSIANIGDNFAYQSIAMMGDNSRCHSIPPYRIHWNKNAIFSYLFKVSQFFYLWFEIQSGLFILLCAYFYKDHMQSVISQWLTLYIIVYWYKMQ